MSTFTGTNGNDSLTGTTAADTFDLQQGGSDTASGLGGDDLFNLGSAFDALDQIDGGAGQDTIALDGNYAAGVVFGAATLRHVETIELGTGNTYRLTIDDGTVDAGETLKVDASALATSNRLVFDGTRERDGSLVVTGGAGNDVLSGGGYISPGTATNTFNLQHGGNDSVSGGFNATNIVNFGSTFTADDRVLGNSGIAGTMTVVLNGDYAGASAVIMNANTMNNVDTLRVSAGHSYTLVSGNAFLGHNGHMLIDGSALGAGDSLHFDGSAQMLGIFDFTGGAGNDVLIASSAGDISRGAAFDLSKGGNDRAVGNTYTDTFKLGTAFTAADHIDGGGLFDNSSITGDVVRLNGKYTGARAVTFGAKTMINVENLVVAAGHSYSLTSNDATVAADKRLWVDASALAAGDMFTFDGSAESDGKFVFMGGAGSDVLTGGKGDDGFYLSKGGNDDTARGGAGDDFFDLGGKFRAGDAINGGSGSDTVSLHGDYSSGVTFNSTTLRNVEQLVLGGGHSYKFTTAGATVAAGATLSVDGSAQAADETLDFNGSAESNGSFLVTAGAGRDIIRGGGGDDSVGFGTHFKANDSFDGGAGEDTVTIGKPYASSMVLSNLRHIEDLQLDGGNYHVTTTDDLVSAGADLGVGFGGFDTDFTLWFDGSAETDGFIAIGGGPGKDHIRGGAHGNSMTGGGNADFLRGGGDHDHYFYDAASDSTSRRYDTIFGFDANDNDQLVLSDDPIGNVDHTIGHGTLSNATFDSDLAHTVTAARLAAHAAVVFTPDAGSHAGQTFLVIDANNQAGYQAGADYVIRLENPTQIGLLSVLSFTSD